VNRCREFESVLNNEQYQKFCELKAKNSTNELDKTVWNVMNVLFEQDPKQKSNKLLQYLGFDKSQISKEIDEQLEKTTEEKKKTIETTVIESEDIDKLIQRALMVANFEAAVKCCLQAGRMVFFY